jgi:hypothetical protein
MREEPESGLDHGAGGDSFGDVGQLVDSDTMTEDREEQAVTDAVPGSRRSIRGGSSDAHHR